MKLRVFSLSAFSVRTGTVKALSLTDRVSHPTDSRHLSVNVPPCCVVMNQNKFASYIFTVSDIMMTDLLCIILRRALVTQLFLYDYVYKS